MSKAWPMWAVVTLDPKTGQRRRGRIERRAFEVALHLPKRLESPNRWLWTHWRVKDKVSKAWAQVIVNAAHDTPQADLLAAARGQVAAAVGWLPPPPLAQVSVLRLVPSARHFMRDKQNLDFASKAVIDKVVKAGFLVDDSDDHIVLTSSQDVSPDGRDWTVITITGPRPDGLTV